jgi:hypothetical protein
MTRIVFYILTASLLFNYSASLAQDTAKKKKGGSDFSFYSWEDNYFYKGKPSIELSFGQSDISLKNS